MSEIDEKAAVVAILNEAFRRYGLPAHTDVPELILAALRDAGWVDPEEAARLRSDYWRARQDRSQLMGERDALLPVVEAARALCGKAKPGRELHIDGPTIRTEFRALHAAVDALDQTAPQTPLSATQSAERPGCGPSCACHPEPLADVSAVSLPDIMAATPDSALGRSAKRVWDQVSGGEERMAGFQSAADDDVISAFQSFVE